MNGTENLNFFFSTFSGGLIPSFKRVGNIKRFWERITLQQQSVFSGGLIPASERVGNIKRFWERITLQQQ